MTIAVFPHRPRVAVPCGCILGEAPIWDGRTGTLHWVDIVGQTLWSWQPDRNREPAVRQVGERVGFVQLTPDPDRVLLGLKSGLATLDLATGAVEPLLAIEPDRPGNRLNDSGIGRDGSLYLGTMDDAEQEPTGRFYRWAGDAFLPFGEPATVTNGPSFDPTGAWLYAADTERGHVLRHRVGPDGEPEPPEPFVTFRPADGKPDGLTVDAEGHVWVCHFGGARVTRFSPEGRAVLDVPMPTAQVTKIAFAGPDLATIYVTTAARGRDREIDLHAGHLLAFECGVRGVPSRICTGFPVGR